MLDTVLKCMAYFESWIAGGIEGASDDFIGPPVYSYHTTWEDDTLTGINRRDFLRYTTLAGGAFAFERLAARYALASSNYSDLIATRGAGAYGALRPTKADNSDETLLSLPEDFHYKVFGKTGAEMSDKSTTPRAHDGMAAFEHKGQIRLVRNHEINNGLGRQGITIGNNAPAYDKLAGGGTSTLVIDPKTRELVKHFVSLSGTLQNCAGGPTPWKSWITCEETIFSQQTITDSQGRKYGGFEKRHGYCFEVPASAEGAVSGVPLKEMGRFVHEAIAVDPKTGIVYETEDRGWSGFYRFIPKKKGDLAKGGRLQMLAVKDRPQYDTRTGQKIGASLPAVWVDIPNPDPDEADTNAQAVFNQGRAGGGATFARLEGCWYGDGKIFFTSTSGGDKRLGQVWEYHPTDQASGRLTLLFESPDANLLEMPDNITVSPRGGLVLCEDGPENNFIRGLTREGRIFDFAKNIVPGFERMEFAGATFSPDGSTLFVNIQTPGITFAIWGPWDDGAL